MSHVRRFATEALGDVKKLQGQAGWRLRVGDWRVVFTVEIPRRAMAVHTVALRRDAYRS